MDKNISIAIMLLLITTAVLFGTLKGQYHCILKVKKVFLQAVYGAASNITQNQYKKCEEENTSPSLYADFHYIFSFN